MKKFNIVLVGFMGTGKTTIGKLLAEKLRLDFIDTDDLIVKVHDKVISEIFLHLGEEAFRQTESDVIKSISKEKGQVIATGGGAIVKGENFNFLAATSHIICLKAQPESILQRVNKNNDRPLLDNADKLKEINTLLEKRADSYDKAHFFVYTDVHSQEQVIDKIIAYLEEQNFFE